MKICLCGSTRFRTEYDAINRLLSKSGHVVYSVATFGHGEHDAEMTDDIKETLDLVHLRKVQESELIVIVGEVDGEPYLGTSTTREVKWAHMLELQVVTLRDADQLISEPYIEEFFLTFGFPPRDPITKQ